VYSQYLLLAKDFSRDVGNINENYYADAACNAAMHKTPAEKYSEKDGFLLRALRLFHAHREVMCEFEKSPIYRDRNFL
jgi:hypothetical protein